MPQITRDLRAFEDSLWLRLYHDVLPQTLGVIRVYDEAGNVIETHEVFSSASAKAEARGIAALAGWLPWSR